MKDFDKKYYTGLVLLPNIKVKTEYARVRRVNPVILPYPQGILKRLEYGIGQGVFLQNKEKMII